MYVFVCLKQSIYYLFSTLSIGLSIKPPSDLPTYLVFLRACAHTHVDTHTKFLDPLCLIWLFSHAKKIIVAKQASNAVHWMTHQYVMWETRSITVLSMGPSWTCVAGIMKTRRPLIAIFFFSFYVHNICLMWHMRFLTCVQSTAQ